MKDRKNTFDEPTLGAGLRGWLPAVPQGESRPAAAFDTRVGGPPAWLTGSAAKHVDAALRDRGFTLACEPTSFLVTKRNELVDDEIQRAGSSVAEALSVAR